MSIVVDALIFSAGYASKLLITGVFVEIAIRPLAKHLARKLRKNEPSILLHYLAQHTGKSYTCLICPK